MTSKFSSIALLLRQVNKINDKRISRNSYLPCKPDSQEPAIPPENHSLPSKLAELFLNLPSELQLAVLLELRREDIFALRLTCRTFFYLTETHQSPLIRRLLGDYEIGGDATTRVSVLAPGPLSFQYYYGLLRRDAVVRRISGLLTDFVESNVFSCKTTREQADFEPKRNNFSVNVYPALKHIMLMLDGYREALISVADVDQNDPESYQQKLDAARHSDIGDIRYFKDCSAACLFASYSMFRILSMIVARKLKFSTLVGSSDANRRGCIYPKWGDQDMVKLFLYGGAEEIANILSCKKYSIRRNALDGFLLSLTLQDAQRKQDSKVRAIVSRFSPLKVGAELRKLSIASIKQERYSTDSSFSTPSTLPSIDCSAVTHLDPMITHNVFTRLPSFGKLVLDDAERVLGKSGLSPYCGRDGLPNFQSIISWATSQRWKASLQESS